MKPTRVVVTLVDERKEKDFTFNEPSTCTVGRSSDCDIQVPEDLFHRDVSRHHCLLEIDPPHLLVRDLGSTNGTMVNGEPIGFGPRRPDDTDVDGGPPTPLFDGDEVRIGGTVLRVHVEEEAPVFRIASFPPVM